MRGVVHIVIGTGEVGLAISSILSMSYDVIEKDITNEWEIIPKGPDYHTLWPRYMTEDVLKDALDSYSDRILNICIPYSDVFFDAVKNYASITNPDHIVIHSTVPIGTSSSLGAVHSPVRGMHPFMEDGLRTYLKFFGGEGADIVSDYFRKAGFKVFVTDRAESTELIKIDSTNWYGVLIEKTKETKRLCDKYGVPFELFDIWTRDQNEGCIKLGDDRYLRPRLVPIMNKIGGHCVVENSHLIDCESSNTIISNNTEAVT